MAPWSLLSSVLVYFRYHGGNGMSLATEESNSPNCSQWKLVFLEIKSQNSGMLFCWCYNTMVMNTASRKQYIWKQQMVHVEMDSMGIF